MSRGLPPVTVVVCTRDRAALLAGCLAALEAVRYPAWELLVVDSAPADATTRELVARYPHARYLREPLPGLDRARNRGWRAARHDIIAFTDDDARPEPGWLRGIVMALAADDADTAAAEAVNTAGAARGAAGEAGTARGPVPTGGPVAIRGAGFAGIAAVTGRVVAASLDTEARRRFERAGGMDKGAAPRVFRGRTLGARALIEVQRVGVGANMAVRRAALERLHGFDEALDVGTPAGGAGDLDLFHRLLAAGETMRYAPDAVVRHEHRGDIPALARQLEASGRAFGVYLIGRWRARSVPRAAIARYVLARWLPWMLWRIIRAALGAHPLPARVLLAQLRGALRSPRAYRAAYAPPPRRAPGATAAPDRAVR